MRRAVLPIAPQGQGAQGRAALSRVRRSDRPPASGQAPARSPVPTLTDATIRPALDVRAQFSSDHAEPSLGLGDARVLEALAHRARLSERSTSECGLMVREAGLAPDLRGVGLAPGVLGNQGASPDRALRGQTG